MFWLALGCVPPSDVCQPCGRAYGLLGDAGLQRAIFWERLRVQRGDLQKAITGGGTRRRKGRRNRERRAA